MSTSNLPAVSPACKVAERRPEVVYLARLDDMSSYLAKASALIERYPPKLRPQLYGGLCGAAGNGWQIIEAFPWLAVRIFVMDDEAATSGRHLVKRGAKLRDVAREAGVSMCFKRFAPKATERLMAVFELLSRHTGIVSHHCPSQERQQTSWLSVIAKASESGDEDFAMWVAIRWQELAGSPYWIRAAVSDLNDWIRACAIEQSASGINADDIEKISQAMLVSRSAESADSLRAWWQGITGAAEAGRPFNTAMKPETVFRLSEEWHLRAAVTEAADVEFPEPWYEGGDVGDYHIKPIRTSPELSRYAYRFHNCASTYAHDIAAGYCFLYVVLKSDSPRAMLELRRDEPNPKLFQLKGPRNEQVSEELETAVDSWYHECKHPQSPRELDAVESLPGTTCIMLAGAPW